MKVAMIGCGKMGGAMLSRWTGLDDFDFTVIDPARPNLPDDVTLAEKLADLSDQRFDLLILAIKPQMIDTVLPDYRDRLTADGCLISVAAGYSIARLEAIMGAVPIIRVMPNLPAMIGRGASGYVGNSATSQKHATMVEALLEAVGTAVEVDSEDMLDRLTAISGSGPGYVFQIIHSYIQAAKNMGFDEQAATALVQATMAGATEMAVTLDESAETLRNNVTSKAGTTEAGLNALNGDGSLDRLMKATIQAAYDRAVALRS